jgi:hypothetical protein
MPDTIITEQAPAAGVMTRRQHEQLRERWTGLRAVDLNTEQLAEASVAGYEPGPDGYMVGRDPRAMSLAELEAVGHARLSPTEAIRAKCLDCCAGSPHEVRLCVATLCPSWPFRTGSNPWRAGKTEAQLEAARKLGEASRLRHSGAGTGEPATPVSADHLLREKHEADGAKP